MLVQRAPRSTRAQPEGSRRSRRCSHAGPAAPRHPHARIVSHLSPVWNLSMDIEQVNAIGSLLADLSARTEQLRGYSDRY